MNQDSLAAKTRFKITMVLLALAYFVYEVYYTQYASLSRDELWFAQHIYHYTQLIPYKDFPPYKTVLGYYLLSIPFYFTHAVLKPLFYIKDQIAFLNAIALCLVSFWGLKFFRPRPLFYTLVLLLSSQLFLIYSTDLRVDMLTSWFCLFSVLTLLSKRYVLSGSLLGLAFLISQKTLWYILSTDGGLLIYFLCCERRWRVVINTFRLNLALLIVIMIYFIAWALIAGVNNVWHSMFYEAYTQSKITFYAPYSHRYWEIITKDGPLLIMLFPLAVFTAIANIGNEKNHRRSIFIASYATILFLAMILYQQTFPYNIVFLFPAFYLLYADFSSRIESIFLYRHFKCHISERMLFWVFSLYFILFIGVSIVFGLNVLVTFILGIPLILYFFLSLPLKEKKFYAKPLTTLLLALILFSGIVIPNAKQFSLSWHIKGDYQQHMMIIANDLLQDGGGYIAGTPLLYDKEQDVDGLKNLIDPSLLYLYTQSRDLLPILISSLDIQPRSVQQVLHDLQQSRTKILIASNRSLQLPPKVIAYLNAHFEHYWGSIYIYSQLVSKKDSHFELKFASPYQVKIFSATTNKTLPKIDDRIIHDREIIYLTAGQHVSASAYNYRLKLIPNTHIILIPKYSSECLDCLTKPIVF